MRSHWAAALLLSTTLISLPAQSIPAPGPNLALERQIAALAAEPAVARAHWGVVVTTLDGAPIAAVNAGQFFAPASNVKLFTTAAAIALLGPQATVETRVLAHGPLIAGILTGDLVLLGAGDANLATDDVPYTPPATLHARREAEAHPLSPEALAKADRDAHPLRALETLAEAVVKAGVTTVTGDLIGDDTLFPWEPFPEAWGIDDIVWGYGAPVSALSVHDNQLALRIRPGLAAAQPATVISDPGLPAFYTIDAVALTTGPARSGTHIGLDRALGSRRVRLWGSIAADAKEDLETIAIDDPAEFAARALKGLLEARGITVRGIPRAQHRLLTSTEPFQQIARSPQSPTPPAPSPTTPAPDQVLASLRSPTLMDDILFTDKVSQNLHAELLLSRLSLLATPGSIDLGSRALGARVVRTFLEQDGLNHDDFVFFDGSGLSVHDLVTPQAIARLLQYAATQPWFTAWRSTLPIAGVDGSLASRFTKPPLTGHVFAKTGTLGEARALSGYLECRSGRTVIFSVMVDTHAPGSTADRDVTDRIVAAVWAAN